MRRIVFPPASSPIVPEIAIDGDEDLVRASARLVELVAAINRSVQSAFTLSASNSSTSEIKSPQFWRSLRTIEALAERIETLR